MFQFDEVVIFLLGSSSFVEFRYTEDRQLRPSTTKRPRIVVDSDSDIETAEESFNTTMESSFLDDSLDSSVGTSTRGADYWKLRALKAEKLLADEKRGRKEDNLAWEEKWKPIEDFLKVEKSPTRGSSGQCRGYSKLLQSFLIDAAADGIAMSDVRKVLVSLSRFLPLTNENQDRRVPEIDFFRKTRTGKLPNVLESHRTQWLSTAEKVIVSVDATQLNGQNHICIGGFSVPSLEYHCLDIKCIEGKTAKQISAIMNAMIESIGGLKGKIYCLLTDRARSQEAANRLLLDLLNRDRDADNLIFCCCCLMHTISRIDARTFSVLSDEAKTVATLLMRIFGSRKTMGFKVSY